MLYSSVSIEKKEDRKVEKLAGFLLFFFPFFLLFFCSFPRNSSTAFPNHQPHLKNLQSDSVSSVSSVSVEEIVSLLVTIGIGLDVSILCVSGTAGCGRNCKNGATISTSEVVGERGVGRAEVRVERRARKREKKRVVMGEE